MFRWVNNTFWRTTCARETKSHWKNTYTTKSALGKLLHVVWVLLWFPLSMDCQGRWEIPQWNIRCRKIHAIHCISYSPQKEFLYFNPKEEKMHIDTVNPAHSLSCCRFFTQPVTLWEVTPETFAFSCCTPGRHELIITVAAARIVGAFILRC